MRVWHRWKYRLLELVFLIICPTLFSEPGKILAEYMQKISILSAFNIYLQQAITVIFPTFFCQQLFDGNTVCFAIDVKPFFSKVCLPRIKGVESLSASLLASYMSHVMSNLDESSSSKCLKLFIPGDRQ